MTAPLPAEPTGFAFLYRTDRGIIGRRTWWRGTLPLVGIGVIATIGWRLVRPYTADALNQPPALAVFAYLYLLAFAFVTLILFVCAYNICAKRFAARGWPRSLAAVLPLSFLGAGALDWYVPRSQGTVAPAFVWLGIAVCAVVVVWFAAELGCRRDRAPAQL